jgi:hypothetical protein
MIKMNGETLNKILKYLKRRKKITTETKIALIRNIFQTLLTPLDLSILLYLPVKNKAYHQTSFHIAFSQLPSHSSFLQARLEKQQILDLD